jgi:Ca2+/Na+ antiporter
LLFEWIKMLAKFCCHECTFFKEFILLIEWIKILANSLKRRVWIFFVQLCFLFFSLLDWDIWVFFLGYYILCWVGFINVIKKKHIYVKAQKYLMPIKKKKSIKQNLKNQETIINQDIKSWKIEHYHELNIFIFYKTLFMQVLSRHFDSSKNIINQKVYVHM